MTKLLLVLAALCLAETVYAAPPPNADPALAPWFRSLRSPTNNDISCCAEADGHVLRESDWRTKGNGYQVRVDGRWRKVPPGAVLNHVDNPTGGAVVFYPPDVRDPPIFCFVRPAEG